MGLLIAKSLLNETKQPVIYLCPTNQLVEQTLEKAKQYNIEAHTPISGQSTLPVDCMNAKAVFICTYDKMFNGLSMFGVHGLGKPPIAIGGIVVDDAHVSFSALRNKFTLNIGRETNEELYKHITALFKSDFDEIKRLSSYEDIINGRDKGNVVEIPYWVWEHKKEEIKKAIVGSMSEDVEFRFVWPLIRDDLSACHCLVYDKSVSIVPILPLMDKIPSFADCKRRIFMSATIADDSSIIRTFGIKYDSALNPIKTNTVAGIGERMILIPELTPFGGKITDIASFTKELLSRIEFTEFNKVILTPSLNASKLFNGCATVSANTDEVAKNIYILQSGTMNGSTFVFANRYDGIDLEGDTCRILVLFGIPSGTDAYELYRAKILSEDTEINNTIAQKIEQGLGRSTRGGADYSVVLLFGEALTRWIGISKHLNSLTTGTIAHLEMGMSMSEDIKTPEELRDVMLQCLNRDQSWVEYHADTLGGYPQSQNVNELTLKVADLERKALYLLRKENYGKAISIISDFLNSTPSLSRQVSGWLLQTAARISFLETNEEWIAFQKGASNKNDNLYAYKNVCDFIPIVPQEQALAIVRDIARYASGLFKKGLIKHLDEISHWLSYDSSSNQFEEALMMLGEQLGFASERPEKKYREGPDALWMLSADHILVIEAKTSKDAENSVNKAEYGQLLTSMAWAEKKYPLCDVTGIIVAPNREHTRNVSLVDKTFIVDIDSVLKLLRETKDMMSDIIEQRLDEKSLEVYCEKLLNNRHLKGEQILEAHLIG